MLEERDHHNRRHAPSGPSETPSALGILVIIMVAAFVLQQLFTAKPVDGVPAGAISVAALQRGEWWTVVTHLFIHDGWMHLLPNVALLVLAGRRVLRDCGARQFTYLFLVSGWAGAAACLLTRPDIPMIGASGAIFGIIGAYAAFHPERDVMRALHRFVPLRLRARSVFLGLALGSALLTVLEWRTRSSMTIPMVHGVAHISHLAGILAGWLYARQLLLLSRGGFPEREEFFPQGIRRRRREEEAKPVAARARVRPGWNDPLPGSELDAAPPAPRTDDEFLRDAVDPVLDKLYAQGMSSLTANERAILDEAAARFSKKSPS